MSRRARAVGFLLAALGAAVAAAAIAQGYGDRVARGYGELRPVVIATAALSPGKPLDPELVAGSLERRRVPLRFLPPGALATPAEALGLAPTAPVPAGAYLLAAQLRPPRTERGSSQMPHGRRPVEIEVGGAGALVAAGVQPGGARVDVLVTTEPTGSGAGRTYLAAPRVPLMALSPSAEGDESRAAATLGLTRRQALRLIDAESFARRVTVIPAG